MPQIIDGLNELSDVQTLIDGAVRESETLEYKTASAPFSDSEKGEIAKDVSAMANSGGGTIIYGVATDRTDKTRPLTIQPLNLKNVETFDRVSNSQIKPPIRGIRKKLVPQDRPQLMIIDVPESENPPHQNLYDKKYYRRSGTESLPMEHDLIALYFGRRTGPILSVIFQPLNRPDAPNGDPPFLSNLYLRIGVENSGKRIGKYVEVIIVFPPADHVRLHVHNINWMNINDLYPGRQARQFVANAGVFHPGLSKSILEMKVDISESYLREHGNDPFATWTVYADGMNPRDGAVSLHDLALT